MTAIKRKFIEISPEGEEIESVQEVQVEVIDLTLIASDDEADDNDEEGGQPLNDGVIEFTFDDEDDDEELEIASVSVYDPITEAEYEVWKGFNYFAAYSSLSFMHYRDAFFGLGYDEWKAIQYALRNKSNA